MPEQRPRTVVALRGAASVSFAFATVLWSEIVALLGSGWRSSGDAWAQGCRSGQFVFGLCVGCPGCYIGPAAPKAWCLGGDLEICVDIKYVGLVGSSSDNGEVVLAGTSRRRLRRWRCVYYVGSCVVWIAGLLACVFFLSRFSLQMQCMVFGSGFSYKLGRYVHSIFFI
jgi:hypothetical protein